MAYFYIGVDLSRDWVDIHVPDRDHVRTPNTVRSLGEIFKGLPQAALVVFEATGGCEAPLMAALERHSVSAVRVNPARARYFAKSLGRAKTDRVDAQMLAEMGRAQRLEPMPELCAAAQDLARLMQRRTQLKDMETQEKQHLSGCEVPRLKASIKTHLIKLKALLSDIEAQIETHIAASPALAEKQALLQSAPGVGPVVSSMLLAYLSELGHLDRRAIASLAGLAPVARESGRWRGHRHIAGGRREVRRALYQAGLVRYRYPGPDAPWIATQRAAGKSAKTIIIALARRLLTYLNAMLRDKTPYQIPTTTNPAK